MRPISHLFNRSKFRVDPRGLTAAMPRALWIELTSKCPYDCVFCTRGTRFGSGRHMNFGLYQSLISELEFPQFISLNYSGESIYYPRLIEAIQLANSTGASTEIVTAFSSISTDLLEAIVACGLDRLAISLHTMDSGQYRDIYRFGSLELLKERVDDLFRIRRKLGTDKPRIDFCFVAIHENLDQLVNVARYAGNVGVSEIFVHPVIGRHPISYDLSRELSANRLQESFKRNLRRAVAESHAAVPHVPITVLNPDIDPHPKLGYAPAYFAPRLPAKARIHTCDQSPFESVHILANGDVAVCEVHDEAPLGNLQHETLREIWHGDRYQEFRAKYVTAEIPECRDCVWKMAYRPTVWKSALSSASGRSPQLLRGWYSGEQESVIWSRRESLLELKAFKSAARVRIAGILPRAPEGRTNRLRIICNTLEIGCIVNAVGKELQFDELFLLPKAWASLRFHFIIDHVFRPISWGINSDTRDLGFALERIEILR